MCVCVCVRERERERERGGGGGNMCVKMREGAFVIEGECGRRDEKGVRESILTYVCSNKLLEFNHIYKKKY